jgi:hypothetical protein
MKISGCIIYEKLLVISDMEIKSTYSIKRHNECKVMGGLKDYGQICNLPCDTQSSWNVVYRTPLSLCAVF